MNNIKEILNNLGIDCNGYPLNTRENVEEFLNTLIGFDVKRILVEGLNIELQPNARKVNNIEIILDKLFSSTNATNVPTHNPVTPQNPINDGEFSISRKYGEEHNQNYSYNWYNAEDNDSEDSNTPIGYFPNDDVSENDSDLVSTTPVDSDGEELFPTPDELFSYKANINPMGSNIQENQVKAHSQDYQDDNVGYNPQPTYGNPQSNDMGYNPQPTYGNPQYNNVGYNPQPAYSTPQYNNVGYNPQPSYGVPQSDNVGYEPSQLYQRSKYNIDTFEDAQKIVRKLNFDDSFRLSVTDIKVFNQFPVNASDRCDIKNNVELDTSFVAILDNLNNLVAFGNLELDDDNYHIILEENHIKYNLICRNDMFKICVIKPNQDLSSSVIDGYKVLTRISLKRVPIFENPLCINLGTSYTSCGTYSYNYKVKLTDFDNYSLDNAISNLCPTMVYVLDCSTDDVKYLFGYQAMERLISKSYDTNASVITDLKSWITSFNDDVEIFDEQDRTRLVPKKDIIKAYVTYIVQQSERFFRAKFEKLYFLTPSKFGNNITSQFKMLLFDTDYTVVECDNSINEDLAIIYEHLERYASNDENPYGNAIILDCGGGSTRLLSYSYIINDDNEKFNVTLKSVDKFEKNFGGKNITDRIFQLLKIKLANYYDPNNYYDLNTLIPYSEKDIAIEVDKFANQSLTESMVQNIHIYDNFNMTYNKVDKFIPTDVSKATYNDEISNSKHNLKYLTNLAEIIKLKFFNDNNVLSINLKDISHDVKIFTSDKYTLNIKDADITITSDEINRVIYADLYINISSLLSNVSLNDTKYYLVGQTSQTPVLYNVLKEFICGKALRSSYSILSMSSNSIPLSGIMGCISYLYNKQNDLVLLTFDTDIDEVNTSSNAIADYIPFYNVSINSKIIIDANNSKYNIYRVLGNNNTLNYEVYDINDNMGKMDTYTLDRNIINLTEIRIDDLADLIVNNSVVDYDSITNIINQLENYSNNDIGHFVFAVPCNDYSFRIFQVSVINDGYNQNKYFYKSCDSNFIV